MWFDCVEKRRRAKLPSSASAPRVVAVAPSFQACLRACICTFCMCVYMCICVYVCGHVYMYIYARVYVYVYVCVYTHVYDDDDRQKILVTMPQRVKQYHRRTYASICICMHTHTYIHIHICVQPAASGRYVRRCVRWCKNTPV